MGNSVVRMLRRTACLFISLIGCFILCCPMSVKAQTGSVSGTVYENDGVTPIKGIEINAYAETCGIYHMFSALDSASTNSDGTYTLSDLPEGTVYIRANQWELVRPIPGVDEPVFNSSFEGEWYGGQIRCAEADPVTVVAEENTPDIDFQLDEAGSISGTVYENDSVTPIGYLPVFVTSSPCAEWADIIGNAYTDDSGVYEIGGLHEGDVYIQVYNSGKNFVGQYYYDVTDCNEAETITVVAGDTATDIDFQLDLGGIVSGTVYANDAVTRVNGLIVKAYSEKCGERPVGSDVANTAGEFTIAGLPPGDVYILASEDWFMDSHYYAEEWYNNAHSCDEADPIVVSAGEEISDIDFFLYLRTDDDNDEMPDDWETEVFGDISRDGSGDYDGDGIVDLDEYLAGTDPKVSDANDDGTDDPGGIDDGTDDQDGADGGGGGCFISIVFD